MMLSIIIIHVLELSDCQIFHKKSRKYGNPVRKSEISDRSKLL